VESWPGMLWNLQPLLEGKFDVVKIDVGNFDKNLDLATPSAYAYDLSGFLWG
jgi:hypothetical protein